MVPEDLVVVFVAVVEEVDEVERLDDRKWELDGG